MNRFSVLDRERIIKNLKETCFDILVIGGGITGAGIALDAASRGMKVALVEMQDFAAGTSSRSTKLVHGGLRYLEHLEFNVVRKVGHEREIVYRNAPHIVIPEKMLLPIVRGGSLGHFTSSIGLKLYDFLAGVKESEKRKMLSLEQTLDKEPLLKSDILEGGALYYEYKTDDSRLTIEVLKKASEYDVQSINYSMASDLIYENDVVCGATISDNLSAEKYDIRAKHVVNATGVWTDIFREKDQSLKNKRLHITKGIHIVVNKSKFNLHHALYFDVGDKRMVFAIPRFDVVYIGTTDTNYDKNLKDPEVTMEDVRYLIASINRITPSVHLKVEDVESVWAGLRPLIHEEGKSPSELSRKDEIFHSNSGLLSIAGGKLTGYRLMAKEVVDIIVKRIEKEEKKSFDNCKSKNIKLSGADFDFEICTDNLEQYIDDVYKKAGELKISKDDFIKLFYRYGSNILEIGNMAKEYIIHNVESFEAWIRAEVWYSVHYEMTSSISDYFVRRTGMIHFFVEEIQTQMGIVVDEMQKQLRWSDEEKDIQVQNFKKEYELATKFMSGKE